MKKILSVLFILILTSIYSYTAEPYEYIKSEVNLNLLKYEISNSTIGINVEYCILKTDQLTIYMESILNPGQESLLEEIVINHIKMIANQITCLSDLSEYEVSSSTYVVSYSSIVYLSDSEYMIFYSAELGNSEKDRDTIGLFSINGSTIAEVGKGMYYTSSFYSSFTGLRCIDNIIPEKKTFEFKFKVVDGGIGKIRRAQILIIKK